MNKRTYLVGAGIAVVTVVLASILALTVSMPLKSSPKPGPSSSQPKTSGPGQDGGNASQAGTAEQGPQQASAAASNAFLTNWVTGDGRVVRRDQGSDTVSEGQAYGLLVALGSHDETRFEQIWTWTKTHLQRPDGLLAWRWDNGTVVDTQPAADADLDTAQALVLAGDTFHRPGWSADGKALAHTILERLTVRTARGRILLPGLWAAKGPDFTFNPSYASPAAFDVLERASTDPRWKEVRQGTSAVTTALLGLSALPPDWAQIKADGSIHALPGPAGTGAAVDYSYDAARLPIRYAQSCHQSDVHLAAKLAPALDRSDPLPAVLDLGGTAVKTDQNPVAYLGRASARAAAGDNTGARADLQRADQLQSRYPTYYGAAWTALGHIMLDTDTLGGCPPLNGH